MDDPPCGRFWLSKRKSKEHVVPATKSLKSGRSGLGCSVRLIAIHFPKLQILFPARLQRGGTVLWVITTLILAEARGCFPWESSPANRAGFQSKFSISFGMNSMCFCLINHTQQSFSQPWPLKSRGYGISDQTSYRMGVQYRDTCRKGFGENPCLSCQETPNSGSYILDWTLTLKISQSIYTGARTRAHTHTP